MSETVKMSDSQIEYLNLTAELMSIRKRGDVPLAYVRTYGCQQNVADSERIKGMLRAAGYSFTEDVEEADFILFNTCAVREHAEDRVFGNVGALKKLKHRHPQILIALCGCMMEQEHVAKRIHDSFPFVGLVFGTHCMHEFPELLYKSLVDGSRVFVRDNDDKKVYEGIPTCRDGKFKGFLPIMYGCDNFCTYCIVPYTRGRERSREPQSILNELADLREKGYREVTLLGQNVNSYLYKGDDGKTVDFAALLALVADAAPSMRVRFTTSNPEDLSDAIIDAMAAHPNICKHIHLPVQSGSNKVLKLMNRKYTREWYLDRIARIRAAMPGCGISTDMFTGFHDETEEDFEQTLSLMREVGFDSAFMFKYSERPGTFAAKHLPDNVPEPVKIDRLNRMIALQNELSLCSNRRDVGRTFEVLVEGYSKRSRTDMYGRTEQNKVIVFPAGDTRIGDRVMCRVDRATSATLLGTRLQD